MQTPQEHPNEETFSLREISNWSCFKQVNINSLKTASLRPHSEEMTQICLVQLSPKVQFLYFLYIFKAY